MDFMTVSLPRLSERGALLQAEARRAEACGFTHFGLGEGPLLLPDCYQALALVSQATERIKVGTAVTNPLTRLPPVTANSIASLAALAPGRVFMGFGAANNAMRSMGFRVARMAEVDNALTVIRGLLAGERVDYEWEGTERAIELFDRTGTFYDISSPIPTFVSAGGPKSLQMAARHADVVLYSLGPNPELIGLVRGMLDDATEAAGRPRGSVKLAAFTHFHRSQDPQGGLDEAIEDGFGAAPLVACVDNRVIVRDHADLLGQNLADDVVAAVAVSHVAEKTDPKTDHLKMFEDFSKGLSPEKRASITERIARTFTVYGTADECLDQVRTMVDAGVDMVAVSLLNPMHFARDSGDFRDAVIARW